MKKKDKAFGMLLGLHVGDSLGATLEFKDKHEIFEPHTEIIGGGLLNWKAGEATDDTDMMLCLLRSISNTGKFDQIKVSKEFLKWFESNPKDVGNTVSLALSNLQRGIDLENCGLKSEMNQGNGSLMRSAPLALIPYSDTDIRLQCSITHSHDNCIACDQLYILFLQDLLNGSSKEDAFNKLLINAKIRSDLIHSALLQIPQINLDDFYPSGFVIDTLVGSICSFMSTSTFENALIKIVNLGGDADTYGAVTGAIAGAYYGKNNIPDRWLNAIKKRKEIESLTENLVKISNINT